MKRLFTIIALCLLTAALYAQKAQKPFHAYLYNNEYEVFLQINFYEQDVTVPGQELYGQLPGYLGKQRNSFCWVITSAKLKDETTAEAAFINDYGSEDFKARITQLNDSTYEFRHLNGSTLKVPKNGRWQKVPSTFQLKRR